MRIGISSWTYTWNLGVNGYPFPKEPMDVFSLLKKAHELGCDVLQIADNLPLESLSDGELARLYELSQKYGILLEVGTKGVDPDTLFLFIKIAKSLGSNIVRTLLHGNSGCPTLEQAENDIKKVLPVLKEEGIVLAIENHDYFPVSQMRHLIESINDRHVRICLDPVNNLAQGDSTNDVFRALGEYTVNFHCKDYTIKRKPSNLGFDVNGCASGHGLLDLPKCAKYFSDRDISFVVELWTPWQGSIEATCALENEWAEKSVEALHKIK